MRNLHVAAMYATLLLALSAVCAATWPWGGVLIWPTVAVLIVTSGYFRFGPGIYGKRAGRIPLLTKFVLAPVIAGQYLSWLYYQRHCRAWDVVAPGVWIGRRLTKREASEAVRQGVVAVLDLSDAFSEAEPFLALVYLHVPVLDLTAPTAEQLNEAIAFINRNMANGVVYVHCKIGYSRSAAIVAAWLLATGRATTIDGAIAHLRSVRPSIVVRPEIQTTLRDWLTRFRAEPSGRVKHS